MKDTGPLEPEAPRDIAPDPEPLLRRLTHWLKRKTRR